MISLLGEGVMSLLGEGVMFLLSEGEGDILFFFEAMLTLLRILRLSF